MKSFFLNILLLLTLFSFNSFSDDILTDCDPEATVDEVIITDNEKEIIKKAFLAYLKDKWTETEIDRFVNSSIEIDGSLKTELEFVLDKIYEEALVEKKKKALEIIEEKTVATLDNKTKGIICREIKKIRINEKYPFTKIPVDLHADDAKTSLAPVTLNEFEVVRKALFEDSFESNDVDFLKWIFTCELYFSYKDLKAIEANPALRDESTSTRLNCIAPNFDIKVSTLRRVDGIKLPTIDTICSGKGTTSKRHRGKTSCNGRFKTKRRSQPRKGIVLEPTTKKTRSTTVSHENQARGKRDLVLHATFSGTIYDNWTKRIIPGANIDFETVTSTTSSSNGTYIIENTEMINEGKEILVSKGRMYESNTLKIHDLKPEDIVPGYDVYLDPKQTDLTGVVYDDVGKPISSETIKITIKYRMDDGQIYSETRTTTTDKEGKYYLKSVYVLYNIIDAEQSTNAYDQKLNDTLTLNPDLEVNTHNITLKRNFTKISGVVKDAKLKNVIPGIKVYLDGILKPDGSKYETITNSKGEYSFEINQNPISISSGTNVVIKFNEFNQDERYNSKNRNSTFVDNTTASVNKNDRSNYNHNTQILMYANNPNRNVELVPLLKDIEGFAIHKENHSSKLANAVIKITSSTGEVTELKTDSRGFYRLRFVKPGSYTVHGSLIDGVKIYDPDSASVVMTNKDIRQDLYLSKIDIWGYVIDGKTRGSVIANAHVKIHYRGRDYDVVTDSRGKYYLHSVPPGNYDMTGEASGYITNTINIDHANVTQRVDIHLVKIVDTEKKMVVVLKWAKDPSDLDTQLVTDRHHLYYKTRGSIGKHTAGFNADLDTDNTTGYGPETVTILLKDNTSLQPLAGKKFNYLVYKYAGRAQLKNAKATVSIFANGEKIHEFKLGTDQTTNSRLWHVFTLNSDGNIVPVNTLSFQKEYEEIARLQAINKKIKEEEMAIREKLEKVTGKLGQVAKLTNQADAYKEELKELTGITNFEKFLKDKARNRTLTITEDSKIAEVQRELSSAIHIRDNYSVAVIAELEAKIEELKATKATLEESKDSWNDADKQTYKEVSEELEAKEKALKRMDPENIKKDIKKLEDELAKIEKRIDEIFADYPLVIKERDEVEATITNEERANKDKYQERIDEKVKAQAANDALIKAQENSVAAQIRKFF